MLPATVNTTPERVRSCYLRHKLDRQGLVFFDLLTVNRRGENKTGFSLSVNPIWEFSDLETMDVVCRRDLELRFRALLDTD